MVTLIRPLLSMEKPPIKNYSCFRYTHPVYAVRFGLIEKINRCAFMVKKLSIDFGEK